MADRICKAGLGLGRRPVYGLFFREVLQECPQVDDLLLFSCCTCLAECNTAKGRDDLRHGTKIVTDL